MTKKLLSKIQERRCKRRPDFLMLRLVEYLKKIINETLRAQVKKAVDEILEIFEYVDRRGGRRK